MKGYNTINEFVKDYKLYLAAKRIDPGRDGETITSFLKKRINTRFENSTKKFKDTLKRNKFTGVDLRLMATHDIIGEIEHINNYLRLCFGDGNGLSNYKKILSTNAFKSGRLKKVYEFIPLSIKSKKDLLDFLRGNRNLTKSELNVIMKYLCEENWENWIEELIEENRLSFRRGFISV